MPSREQIERERARILDDATRRRAREVSESDATQQRRRMMTREEKAREAIEGTARSIKDHNEQRGKDVSYDECHRAAVNIANGAERKRDR